MTAKIRACILASSFATSCRAGEDADEPGISSSTAADASGTSGASSETGSESSEASSDPAESSSGSTDVSSTSGDPPTCEGIEPPTDGFHVTVDGTPDGDGSIDAPWDLATALAHPSAVTPGSTIWVHGGAYPGPFTSTLTGTAEAPIVLRAVPGERATLDGTGIAAGEPDWMRLEGAHTWLWGFEITTTHTDPDLAVAAAFSIDGTGIKLVNLVVHDVFNNGFFQSAVDLEMYGTLFYNVGHNAFGTGAGDDPYGYPMYLQNLEGSKRVEDNIVMNNYSFGLHAYTEGGYLEQISLVGNVWFNNGAAAAGDGKKDDILLGPVNNPARGIVVRDNAVWARGSDMRAVRFGYGAPNEDIELVGNYIVGQTLFSDPWSSITMTDNTFFAAPTGEIDPGAHPRNAYLDATPTENMVRVRANRYEPGRAHVVVYNWEDADTVAVDLGDAIEPGTAFEVRNAQTFWDAPVASGVFDGSAVDLPMAEVVPSPANISPENLMATERTGRAFHVFVVVPTACP